jgi:hypothetical protein
MTTTRARILVTALCVSSLGLSAASVAPSAAASPVPGRTIGGCGFDSDSLAIGSDQYTGIEYDRSITRDTDGLPTGATVSCKIVVNGVDAPGTEFDYLGYGVQAGANPISFAAGPADVVTECQRTVYADGGDTGWVCPGATTLPIPPQWVIDDIAWLVGIVNDVLVWDVDPRACPLLAAHSGSYGPVTVDPDGDVSVADPLGLGLDPVYDCPPYRSF